MKLEDEVTADEVLKYALNHMNVHYSMVKQKLDYTYFDETSSLSSNFDESFLPMVDPSQFTLALKISPSCHKSNSKKLNEDLQMLSPETLFHYTGDGNQLEIKSLSSDQHPPSAPRDLIPIKGGASLLR